MKDDDPFRGWEKIDGIEPDIKPREIKWERPPLFSRRAIFVYFLIAVFWFLFIFVFRGCGFVKPPAPKKVSLLREIRVDGYLFII